MTDRKIVLPEGEYAQYLATLAAEIADSKAQKREGKWRSIAAAGFTLIAFFGFLNLNSIEADLDQKIEEAETRVNTNVTNLIQTEVREFITNNRETLIGRELERLQLDLDQRLALLQLVIVANDLREGDGFTHETRSAAVELLEIVSNNKSIVETAQFTKPLQDIVDAFLAADQQTFIDDIDNKLRDVVSKQPGIVQSMVNHYGFRVLGSVARDELVVEKLTYYSELISHAYNSPELAAPFLLGSAFIASNYSKDTIGEGLIDDAKHWSISERATFLDLLNTLESENFVENSTGDSTRISDLMSKVKIEYDSELVELLGESDDFDTESSEADEEFLNEMFKLMQESE